MILFGAFLNKVPLGIPVGPNVRSEVDVSCVLVLDYAAGWVQNKTHETSTSERMISGVRLLLELFNQYSNISIIS